MNAVALLVVLFETGQVADTVERWRHPTWPHSSLHGWRGWLCVPPNVASQLVRRRSGRRTFARSHGSP